MTGAEWMSFRFGEGAGGQAARIVMAVGTLVSTVGMLAYAMKGVGLFFAMFLPFTPLTCALLMVGVTTVYTMMSGFYGVVYSNLFQGIVIIIAVVVVAILAAARVPDVQTVAEVARAVTGNAAWTSSAPSWHTTMPAGYEMYQSLIMFMTFYLIKAIIQGMGFGDDPRYFGAKSERDCGLLTFLWATLMTVRWPLIAGFAVMGLFVIHDLFPDPASFSQAAELVRHHVGVITKAQWTEVIARVINTPGNYPQALIDGLHGIFGADWGAKLQLVSFEGTVNPERIMPAVLIYGIPPGLRGLIMIALLAAEMSTFSATVNRAAGYFTRDLYQRFFRPRAGNRELIAASWGAVSSLVLIAFLFAFTIRSINDIWGWITMGLGSGLLVPAFLRFYWWRFNGGGFAIGTLVGMAAAIGQRALIPGLDERLQFLIIAPIGLLASVAGTWWTAPTDRGVVERFYQMTRPFGLWRRFTTTLTAEVRRAMRREHQRDLLALPFALTWQVTMYLLAMQVVIGMWDTAATTLVIFLGCLGVLYFLWFRHLPQAAPAPPIPSV
jgi:Na+/proline symporter